MAYINPTTTKIITSSNVTWSGGQLFSGYLLLGISLPRDAAGVQWANINLYGTSQPLPQWTVIPIVEGVLDTNTTVFPNSQLDPPNTKYAPYWCDNTWKLVYPLPSGTIPTPITISGTTYTITPPTITAPATVTSADVPVPEDIPAYTSDNVTYAIPTEYTLTGTANGTNLTFTIPVTSVIFAMIFLDGQKMKEGVDYTRSGIIVTFITAPTSGSQVMGLVI